MTSQRATAVEHTSDAPSDATASHRLGNRNYRPDASDESTVDGRMGGMTRRRYNRNAEMIKLVQFLALGGSVPDYAGLHGVTLGTAEGIHRRALVANDCKNTAELVGICVAEGLIQASTKTGQTRK